MPKGVAKKNLSDNSNSQSNASRKKNVTKRNPKDEEDINHSTNESKSKNNSSKEKQEIDLNDGRLSNGIDKTNKTESGNGEDKSAADSDSDLNFFIEDVRGSIKDRTLFDSSSQVLPGSTSQKTKRLPKFIQRIDNWMYGKVKNPFSPYKHVTGSQIRKRSPIRIIILILLLICMGYVVVFAGNNLRKLTPIAIPTKTPVPTYSVPVPFSVQFPGGWNFKLGISSEQFADWEPAQAEWFKDTTICKLIAIPWTKQIDAVYNTLQPGEELILTMSNNDVANYQIETLETYLVENIINKLNRNSPCMIIFLYRENTRTAQTIISAPPTPTPTP